MMSFKDVILSEIACDSCEVGLASGRGAGQFCPFIIRRHPAGEELCAAGDPAEYVWFVKQGVVALTAPQDPGDLVTLGMPGSFIGLECLLRDTYAAGATTLTPATLCGATRSGFERWSASGDRLRLALRAARGSPR
jgi:CRP-like cAMP-binding protein